MLDAQPLDRLDEDEDRERDEGSRVEERCDHSGAVVAIRLLRGRWTAFEAQCEQREEKRQRVREVMQRVADQRERTGEDPGAKLQQHEDKRRDRGDEEFSGSDVVVMHCRGAIEWTVRPASISQRRLRPSSIAVLSNAPP